MSSTLLMAYAPIPPILTRYLCTVKGAPVVPVAEAG